MKGSPDEFCQSLRSYRNHMEKFLIANLMADIERGIKKNNHNSSVLLEVSSTNLIEERNLCKPPASFFPCNPKHSRDVMVTYKIARSN